MATKSQVQEEPKPQVIEEELLFQTVDVKNALAALKQASGGNITPLTLTQLRMPSGNATQFKMKEKSYDALTGIVLAYHPARTKYEESFEMGRTAPVCTSEDGVTGSGKPGGPCATCIYAQFEHPRETKCALFYRLYLLPLDAPLPIHFQIPLMNMKIIREHFQGMSAETGKFTYQVVTEFSLGTKENTKGTPYSVLVCKTVGFLNPEAVKAITGYAESLQGQFTAPQITQGSTPPKESLPLFTEVADDEPEDIPF